LKIFPRNSFREANQQLIGFNRIQAKKKVEKTWIHNETQSLLISVFCLQCLESTLLSIDGLHRRMMIDCSAITARIFHHFFLVSAKAIMTSAAQISRTTKGNEIEKNGKLQLREYFRSLRLITLLRYKLRYVRFFATFSIESWQRKTKQKKNSVRQTNQKGSFCLMEKVGTEKCNLLLIKGLSYVHREFVCGLCPRCGPLLHSFICLSVCEVMIIVYSQLYFAFHRLPFMNVLLAINIFFRSSVRGDAKKTSGN
jgi:hypothetical protein